MKIATQRDFKFGVSRRHGMSAQFTQKNNICRQPENTNVMYNQFLQTFFGMFYFSNSLTAIFIPDYLKKPLDQYVKQLAKVKLIHTQKREGLIRARLIGMNATTAEILTFLDSHIECTKGWLEPLLECIHANHTNVVSPVIDRIKDDTFAYEPLTLDYMQVGGFDWDLSFSWHFLPHRDQNRPGAPYSPINTPTIAGGLFSIHRGFFERLGFYDQQMEVWGGENLELSFKTWMCGGSLKIHPCSHIGHVFRAESPYMQSNDALRTVRRNLVRLAEVWMDDYKGFFYERLGFALPILLYLIFKLWFWTHNREIRRDNKCWTVDEKSWLVRMFQCRASPMQMFEYTKHGILCVLTSLFSTCFLKQSGTLQYKNLCIELHSNNVDIYLAYCTGLPNQVWKFARIAHTSAVGYTIAPLPIR
ncbi:polypeptide N-acetylgalactosaminyltransferase [Paragonimus westermani]|uniref:Polypeptide N-acetylgalactosaminyltransferase n=1 Tax=Paragonimus westermani TaxID=34504 RepID=A0A5J4NX28_9TREM|nr:polypeptide N-acetylgalactosaminyltransferase [Paragonimus westermani]